MGRRAFVVIVVVLRVVMMFGCAPFSRVEARTSPLERVQYGEPEKDPNRETGLSLASFADELAISLEPSKLEDETTATEVYVFNRGSRTWVIPLETTPDGKRSVELDVRDVAAPDRDLPPAPIGITAQCPRAPSKDVHVVGPGERGLIACVEKLVDVRNVEELELEVGLQFKAADGSEIYVRSPAFRVARRPAPPTSAKKR